jgi:uncharacterized membrane protein
MTNIQLLAGLDAVPAYSVLRRVGPADLVGPFVAVCFYEVSRRRELGLGTFWIDIFDLRNLPSLPSILLLGFALLTLFFCWERAAEWLYLWLFGPAAPESLYAFFIGARSEWDFGD